MSVVDVIRSPLEEISRPIQFILSAFPEEQAAIVHRKLSLVGGKTKKMKKLQTIQLSSTPPRSPSFDTRHNKW